MRNFVLAAALAAMCLTGCARNQASDDGSAASPEMRAQMQAARSAAKSASLAELSDDHRAKVEAVAQKFDDGSLELEDATTQIDAILSTSESQAVLAEQKKMRDALRAAAAAGGGSGSRNGFGGRRPPDAGRFLLSVLASPDKYREAIRRPSGQ